MLTIPLLLLPALSILVGCPLPKKIGNFYIAKQNRCVINGPIAIQGNITVEGKLVVNKTGGLYLLPGSSLIVKPGGELQILGKIGTANCTNECDFNTTKCENKAIWKCTTTGDTDPCTEWVKIKDVQCCSDSDCPNGYYCENYQCKKKVVCSHISCCEGKNIYLITYCSDGTYSKSFVYSCGEFQCGSLKGDGWYSVSELGRCVANIYGCYTDPLFCYEYTYIKVIRTCCSYSCPGGCGQLHCENVMIASCKDATISDVENEALKRIGYPECYSIEYCGNNCLIIKVYEGDVGYCNFAKCVKSYKVTYSFGNIDSDPCKEIASLDIQETSC